MSNDKFYPSYPYAYDPKFSPGKWVVQTLNEGAAVSIQCEGMPTYKSIYPGTSSEGHFEVCKMSYSRDTDYTPEGSQLLSVVNKANANLIAAAPEMHRFLFDMKARHPDNPWLQLECNRLIALADGKG